MMLEGNQEQIKVMFDRTNEMSWWVSWVDDDGDMFASKRSSLVEGPAKTSWVNTASQSRRCSHCWALTH